MRYLITKGPDSSEERSVEDLDSAMGGNIGTLM